MTWAQWVDSSYNTGGFVISGTRIYKPSGTNGFVLGSNGASVKMTDTISSGESYTIEHSGGEIG